MPDYPSSVTITGDDDNGLVIESSTDTRDTISEILLIAFLSHKYPHLIRNSIYDAITWKVKERG